MAPTDTLNITNSYTQMIKDYFLGIFIMAPVVVFLFLVAQVIIGID